MTFRVEGNVSDVRLYSEANALGPIMVTPSGMLSVVSLGDDETRLRITVLSAEV